VAQREGLKKQIKDKAKNYLFDILNDIKIHKKGNLLDIPEYERAFDKFMIMRFLSMNDDICEIINYVNDFQDILSKKQLYKLLVEIVPVTRSYDAYIKSDKEEIQESTTLVSTYFTNETTPGYFFTFSAASAVILKI
jgi:hypothetical protein